MRTYRGHMEVYSSLLLNVFHKWNTCIKGKEKDILFKIQNYSAREISSKNRLILRLVRVKPIDEISAKKITSA